MGLLQNIFTGDAFGAVTLTDEINTFPAVPGLIGGMDLFHDSGVHTTMIQIQEHDEQISLVQTQPRCVPGENNKPNPRRARSFIIPHIPKEDFIQSCELEGVLAGSSDSLTLKTAKSEVSDRMRVMSASLDATEEWHLLGAVNGLILDADGSVIYDLYAEFGVTPLPTVQLDFSVLINGLLKQKLQQTRREQSKVLKSVSPTGYVLLAGDDLYDGFITSGETQKAYDRWQDGEHLRSGGLAYDSFDYGGVTVVNYEGYVNGQDFIAPNKGRLIPRGVPGLFRRYYAPADRMRFLATRGVPRYAFTHADPEDRFVKLSTQTNPLSICTQPRALREFEII